MKYLDAFLKNRQYHFQHIVRMLKDFLQIFFSFCLHLQYAFFQQRLFIRKNFIKRTLGYS